MGNFVLVGLGGMIGSILRYAVSGYAQQITASSSFPVGTVVVNVLGCFVIGFLSQLAEDRGVFTPEARALIFVGVLGGFTTFSTFANESMNLIRDGEAYLAIANVALQVGLGLTAVWLGRAVAFSIWR